MSIVVFWLGPAGCSHLLYEDDQLKDALASVAWLRTQTSVRHVTISTELAGMVGKPGVDSVEDGKTPDGFAYDWNKNDRRRTR